MNLVLAARRPGPLAALSDELRARHHVETICLEGDLADTAFVDRLAAACVSARPGPARLQRRTLSHRGVRRPADGRPDEGRRRQRAGPAASGAGSAAGDAGPRPRRRDSHVVAGRHDRGPPGRSLRGEQGLQPHPRPSPVVRGQGHEHRHARLLRGRHPHSRLCQRVRQGRPRHAQPRRRGRTGPARPRSRADHGPRACQPAGRLLPQPAAVAEERL